MAAKSTAKRIYGGKHFRKVRTCIGPCGAPFEARQEGQWVCPKCRRTQDPNDGSFLPATGKVERLELSLFEITNGETSELSYWRRYVIARDCDDAKNMARSGFLAVGLATGNLRVKSCLPCVQGMISEISDSGMRVAVEKPPTPTRHSWRQYAHPLADDENTRNP